MLRYVLNRIIWTIPILLLAIALTFSLILALPGHAVISSPGLANNPGLVKALEKQYNLDKPPVQRYFFYIGDLLQGDMGPSSASTSQDVGDQIADSLPVSAELGLWAFAFASFFGLLAGMLSALKHNTMWDYAATTISTLGFAIPSFMIASFWTYYIGLQTDVFVGGTDLTPIAGWTTWAHRIGPAIVLGLAIMPYFARLIRGTMLETLQLDYVTTAKSKGLRWRTTVLRHVLRNSLIPVITNAAPLFGFVITGSFIIERIFNIPGLGQSFVQAITNRDFNLVLGTMVLLSVIVITLNLLVDILYGFLDPRIRTR